MGERLGKRICTAILALCVSVTCWGFAAGNASASDGASIRILQYDEKGNVIGATEHPLDAPVGPGSPETSAPASIVPPGDYRTPPRPPTLRFEPNEVLVANAPPPLIGVVGALGFSLVERILLPNLGLEVLRLRIPQGQSVDQALAEIRSRFPGVITDPNAIFDLSEGKKDPGFARRLVGWDRVTPSCGRGIRIGMIDTMVDRGHPALRGQRIVVRSFLDRDIQAAPGTHGTGIAGVLVGRVETTDFVGLLPGASLFAANIFGTDSTGAVRGNLAAMMRALDWLAQERVHAINLSLAGSGNSVLDLLIERARAKQLLLIAAAGNSGSEAPPAHPAAHPEVVAVTAVDRNLNLYAHANRGDYIDFAAPGVNLWTATPEGGAFQSGTSFAVPFVAALAALHRFNGDAADAHGLRKALVGNVRDLGPAGFDPQFGWGLVRTEPVC